MKEIIFDRFQTHYKSQCVRVNEWNGANETEKATNTCTHTHTYTQILVEFRIVSVAVDFFPFLYRCLAQQAPVFLRPYDSEWYLWKHLYAYDNNIVFTERTVLKWHFITHKSNWTLSFSLTRCVCFPFFFFDDDIFTMCVLPFRLFFSFVTYLSCCSLFFG